MRLSVLDQAPITDHLPRAEAVRASLDLAVEAERLGYHRIWFAEHHDSSSFACNAPEILVAGALERTTRIRVGTGSILLPLQAPAKVAETFEMLAHVYGPRVDAGLGQASYGRDDYPERVAAVSARLAEIWPDPVDEPVAHTWIVGSGTRSAPVAGRLGAGYVHGHFLQPGNGEAGLAAYRAAVGGGAPRAYGALAVRIVVAETAERAAALANSTLLWRIRKDLGFDGPIPSVERAAAHSWSDAELARLPGRRPSVVSGTPADVRAQLEALAASHGVDELMLNTLLSDPADRLESYRLIAEAFGA